MTAPVPEPVPEPGTAVGQAGGVPADVVLAHYGGAPEALGHGGDPVASVALYLLPHLCAPDHLAPRGAAQTVHGLPVTGFGTLRAGGAEFALPLEIAEIAPGGVQAPDPRAASAGHGARIVARLVAAAADMLTQMKARG